MTEYKTALEKAKDYFVDRMNERVLVVYKGKPISLFSVPAQGMCYYLSAWAIMGLENGDKRVVGTINESRRLKPSRDYKHAWVEFKYRGRWYIYDSRDREVYTRKDYKHFYEPRNITSKLTQTEIFELYLKPKHAYTIKKGYDYVFKKRPDTDYGEEEDGYLRDALSRGHLYVSSCPPYPDDIEQFSTNFFVAARH